MAKSRRALVDAPRILIEHTDGRLVSVIPADFKRAHIVFNQDEDLVSYEEAGFKPQSWESKDRYEAPERPQARTRPERPTEPTEPAPLVTPAEPAVSDPAP